MSNPAGNPVVTKGDILRLLSDMAILYRKEGIRKSIRCNRHMNQWKGEGFNQALADAMLVDFINFIGNFQGIDYGIYTRDLSWDTFSPGCSLKHPFSGRCMQATNAGKACRKKGCPAWKEDDRGVGRIDRNITC